MSHAEKHLQHFVLLQMEYSKVYFFYIISICCTIFSPWLYKTWGGAVWLCSQDMDIFVRIHQLFIYLFI